MHAKLLEQQPMPGLGRHMAGQGVIERIGAELRQRRHGGGADEAVEQDRNAQMPRGERRAEDGGKLASAQRGGDAQRIAEDRAVPRERRIDRRALALRSPIVDAGAVTGEAQPPPPNRAAATAAAAVVLPMPISPSTTRSASGDSAS